MRGGTLRRFEERRAPTRRDIEQAEWRLSFSELARHPTIRTGRGSAPQPEGQEPGSGDERFLLALRRPDTTDCPPPPALLEGWLLDGWRSPLSEAEFLPSQSLPDGRVEAFNESP